MFLLSQNDENQSENGSKNSKIRLRATPPKPQKKMLQTKKLRTSVLLCQRSMANVGGGTNLFLSSGVLSHNTVAVGNDITCMLCYVHYRIVPIRISHVQLQHSLISRFGIASSISNVSLGRATRHQTQSLGKTPVLTTCDTPWRGR